MKLTARRTAVLAGLTLTMAWAGAAPAAVATPTTDAARSSEPRTVRVSGRQIPVDVANGWWEMRGALVGTWHAVPLTVLHSDPNRPTLYSDAGVEVFTGCIDRRPRDGRCTARDYRGELHATFLSWASFESDGTTLIQGQCVHPITGGKGAFAGARGLITMVDRPVGDQIRTTYSGDIVLNAVPTEGDAPTPAAVAGTRAAQRTSNSSSLSTSERQGC